MSKDLINKEKQNHELSLVEQVVVQGDLSKLSPQQRVLYYRKVCESAGLNPFTRPFDYITFQGKLTLYARKDATEQLRKINGISIEGLEESVVDDLYIIKATAKTKDGRTDTATGAVSLLNLKGEQKANAIMKAETKAKRRVTLSISGMGWTDESEIDSIPGAIAVKVDLMTGEMQEPTDVPLKIEEQKPLTITKDQANELGMILGDCEAAYQDKIKNYIKMQYKTENLSDLPADKYKLMKESFLKNMEAHIKAQQNQPRLLEV